MNKRVHQIAKERGVASKELLERLRAAGIDVKAASNVDEEVALKVLDNGAGTVAPVTDGKRDDPAPPPPSVSRTQAPATPSEPAPQPPRAAAPPAPAPAPPTTPPGTQRP